MLVSGKPGPADAAEEPALTGVHRVTMAFQPRLGSKALSAESALVAVLWSRWLSIGFVVVLLGILGLVLEALFKADILHIFTGFLHFRWVSSA